MHTSNEMTAKKVTGRKKLENGPDKESENKTHERPCVPKAPLQSSQRYIRTKAEGAKKPTLNVLHTSEAYGHPRQIVLLEEGCPLTEITEENETRLVEIDYQDILPNSDHFSCCSRLRKPFWYNNRRLRWASSRNHRFIHDRPMS